MRVLAEASSYILFELAGERAGSASVVGTLLRPVLVPLRGDVDRVGIKLRPGAANLFFGLSARDVCDRNSATSVPGFGLRSSMNSWRLRTCALACMSSRTGCVASSRD
jgi:hypothetical protein